MTGERRRGSRPARARRRPPAPGPDGFADGYAGAFAVERAPTDGRSPEQWARAMFEGAPPALRTFVLVGWRGVLGLRLGPRRSPDHVLGWRIVGSTHDAITLEVRSALLTAVKEIRVTADEVVASTYVRFDRRAGRLLWSAVTPVHHLTEPRLVTRSARHPGEARPA